MRRLVVLGAFLLLIFLPSGLHAQPTAPQTTEVTEPGQITLYYPLVPLAADLTPLAAVHIEEQIRQAVLDLLALSLPYGNPFGSYAVHLETEHLLSLTLTVGGYRPPAAHPMSYARSLTFDRRTGRLLGLDDLFQGDYLTRISDLIELQIETHEDELPLLRPFTGIDPTTDFYLTPDALIIYFQLYDLLPYAWGFPEFRIPYDRLCDVTAEAYRGAFCKTEVD